MGPSPTEAIHVFLSSCSSLILVHFNDNLWYTTGDVAWVLASTALVWIMIPGVGFFYSGLARRKSALSLIWLSLMSISVVSFQVYLPVPDGLNSIVVVMGIFTHVFENRRKIHRQFREYRSHARVGATNDGRPRTDFLYLPVYVRGNNARVGNRRGCRTRSHASLRGFHLRMGDTCL